VNLHERLYRYFAAHRTGHPPITTNLTGLYGGNSRLWLADQCDTAWALDKLKRRNVREWMAVALRWHFLLDADDIADVLKDAEARLNLARRRNDQQMIAALMEAVRLGRNRMDYLHRQRESWEGLQQYADGMLFLQAVTDSPAPGIDNEETVVYG